MLAQPPRRFVHVGSLSLWPGFEIARATLSSLCVGQIALVVARCEFCNRAIFSALGACQIALAVSRDFFFEIPSALCACQIALAVARCSFH